MIKPAFHSLPSLKSIFLYVVVFALCLSCNPSRHIGTADDGQIEFTILQLNDVYEITPLADGTQGGMARVAWVRDSLVAKNKNTLTVLSGDFLNPSLIGTMRYEGERIYGKQMIELMNAAGVDLVTFGNHEFDLSENILQKRINESAFRWISTNYQQKCGDRTYPFYKEVAGEKEFFPKSWIWNINDADGTSLRIGFFSAVLPLEGIDYIYYEDHTLAALNEIEKLKSSCDILLGITHLNIKDDITLAKEITGVPLLLGGHDHDHMLHQIGDTRISKADANAKTVYIHMISFDTKTKNFNINSQLKNIDSNVPFQSNAAALVEKWNTILKEGVQTVIDDPFSVIHTTTLPLDGRESTIRHRQSNLGALITDAMIASSENQAHAAILNSGSIRIDDQLHGRINSIDIFRVLPFGGQIYLVKIKGNLLKGVLQFGENAKGNGAFLQRSNITWQNDQWYIGDQIIEDEQNYWVAMNDFLLAGKDIHFLTTANPGVIDVLKPQDESIKLRGDIRRTIIQYLRSQKK